MAARGSLARFGLIARGAQVNLRNVLRSDTPTLARPSRQAWRDRAADAVSPRRRAGANL